MEGEFVVLDSETRKKIKELHREYKAISDEFYFELEDAKNLKQLIKTLKKHIKIQTEDECMKITYYIHKETTWHRTNKEKQTKLNQWQSAFMDKLISNEGIYERDKCLRETLTDQQIFNQLYGLEELEFIISIRTKRRYGSKTIFIIHPQILKEV